jgi:hypothetical protein
MLRPTLVLGAVAAAAALVVAVPALAGGNGSTTTTGHAHGTDVSVVGVIGVTPPPDLPAGCPLQLPIAFLPTTGNAIFHDTTNKAGDDWFTTTFTGQVDAYAGTVIDDEGDVAPVGGVLYSGHLTTWFGSEDNKQNGVFHATLDFHGTSSTDPSQTIRLHGSFDVTFNANGEATATPANASCTT